MSEQLSQQNDVTSDALGDILGKILISQTQGSEKVTPTESTPLSAGGANTSSSVGDIFSSLLAKPDLLVKLPSIISAAKPIIDMLSQQQQKKNTTSYPSSDSISKNVSANVEESKPAPLYTRGREAECRNALLCAMKPYLSSDRQKTVDYIVKLSRLGDILKTL